MNGTQFEYLFTPIKIRNVTIRNRIVSTGHGTLLGSRGAPSSRLIDYHVERAKGGCGMIAVELASVHPSSLCPLIAYDEKTMPQYKALTEAVHEQGAKIVLQIGHTGRQRLAGSRLTWAASPIPCQFFDATGLPPKEMETEDIHEIVQAWGRAAALAKASGFDGVEIHSLYGNYLLSGFLSPYSNKRTDEYGGTLENRMRIVYEVMASVRKHVGRDYMVGMQLNGDDLTPTGLGLEEYKEIAGLIDRTGQIDYITVKAGTYWVPNMVIPDMQHPPGLWVPFASALKEETRHAAIVCVGRIHDPVFAEKVLADGHADMIGMCRAQIADPELANKAREGRLTDIRPCVACNQGCFERMYGGFGCIHNPAAGREKQLGSGTLKLVSHSRRVLVIGGGPAGLKAAETAARRGHKVSLYERRSCLGGQVNIAAKGAGRAELAEITRYLAQQIEKLGVEIQLGVEVTDELVKRLKPDVVVVATGSIPQRLSRTGVPPYDPDTPEQPKGADQSHVLTAWDLLENNIPVGRKIVVADNGQGHWKAASISELLLDRGCDVELLSPLDFPIKDIGPESRPPLLRRLFSKGIALSPYTEIKEILRNSVVVYNIYGRRERVIENVDHVVLAYYHKAHDGLYHSLKGHVKELHRIGDCLAPRTTGDAIRDGENIGRAL